MIPLRDNIPTRHFPVITVSLIVLNVIVFLADQLAGHYETLVVRVPGGYREVAHFVGAFTQNWGMVPASVSGNLGDAWPTVFSSMFLHANWLHLGGNMLMLWIFGNNIEDTLGRGRFILFYLACGVAAAAAHIYTGPQSQIPTVGASGAVAGLMGAYLILFPHAEILALVPIFFISTLMEVPALLVIGLWAILQYINASYLGGGGMLRGGGVAYWAHLGGLFAGIILISLLGGRRLAQQRDEHSMREDF